MDQLSLDLPQSSEEWVQERLRQIYGVCETHPGTSLDGYEECNVCVLEATEALARSPWVKQALAAGLPPKVYR